MSYVDVIDTSERLFYFYESGAVMLKIVGDAKGEVTEIKAWDKKGKKINPKTIIKELEHVDKLYKEHLAKLSAIDDAIWCR